MSSQDQLLYFENQLPEFSTSFALGLIAKKLGQNKSVAYIDTNSKNKTIFSFFEQLSLIKEFKKELPNFYMETFLWNVEKDTFSRSILPQLEYQILPNRNYFLKLTKHYDYFIFNSITNDIIDLDFLSIILQSPRQPKIILISNEEPNKKIKKYLTYYQIKKEQKNSLLTQNITLVQGSPYTESFAQGYIIEEFLKKSTVKFIAFDKGKQRFGEEFFFTALKQSQKKLNKGDFDFIYTGNPNPFREEFTNFDYKEAKETVELLKTALKKQSPVVAENAIQTHIHGLIDKKEFLNLLSIVKQELVLTHTSNEIPKYILDYVKKSISILKITP
jgi:hypothetical protein